MKSLENVRLEVNQKVSKRQLFDFYVRNKICERAYGQEKANKPLTRSSLIVAAFEGRRLVGIARAMCDGLCADIMEFCVDLDYQGAGLKYRNGSLIGKDESGLGKKIGGLLITTLREMGADAISCTAVRGYEEQFYASLGFEAEPDAVVYSIDRRPYLGDERYVTRPEPDLPA